MTNVKKYIEVNPNVCHGQPCFAGTRIMVYLVLELLESGVDSSEILTRYYPKLTPKHIQAALHFAADLIKNSESVPFAKIR